MGELHYSKFFEGKEINFFLFHNLHSDVLETDKKINENVELFEI